MAVVVVQVGQCGNQIGDEFFHQLSLIHRKELSRAGPLGRASGELSSCSGSGDSFSSLRSSTCPNRVHSTFFTRDGFARCVLIDSEPKVVQGVYQRHPQFIRQENVVYGQSGRGNNWGLGYFGVNDPRHIKKRHEPLQENGNNNSSNSGGGGNQQNYDERWRQEGDGRSFRERTGPDTNSRTGGAVMKARRTSEVGGGAGRRESESFQRNPLPSDTRHAFKNLHKSQRILDDGLFANALNAIYNETRRTADIEDDVDEGFESIILLHSLSGGTGSGLASRLAERIRLYFVQPPEGAPDVDELLEDKMRQQDGLDGCLWMEKRRAKYLISITLAPMSIGEVATQSINTALTLELLLKHTDAILLLRNDDLLSQDAGGMPLPSSLRAASSSSPQEDAVTAGDGGGKGMFRSLLPSCTTFKDANEVIVALLLPLFHYGYPCSSLSAIKRCRTKKGATVLDGKAPPSYSSAGIEAMVSQLAPRGCRETGCNTLLTVLPTPQRVYGRFRHLVHRCRFYGLQGGKEFLPGCRPEPPDASIVLSRRAAERHQWLASENGSTHEMVPWNGGNGGGGGGEWMSSLREDDPSVSSLSTSSPLYPNGPPNAGKDRRGYGSSRQPLWQSVTPRTSAELNSRKKWQDPNEFVLGNDADHPNANEEAEGQENLSKDHSDMENQGARNGNSRNPIGEDGEGMRRKGIGHPAQTVLPPSSATQKKMKLIPATRRSAAAEEGKCVQTLVYDCVSVSVPPSLRQYYASVRRSPIASFLEKIEGVAVLNQVRELNASLLFPLLRSVAFKVKVGAYMSIYEEVGIPSTKIEKAYRTVAEALLIAEEVE